ncbi:YcfL family protein [Azohydromonas caseinilytica]|uniref:YcfL family protein n=1 Tax=Azohydromonas caseinilytica TaxID=2728836 RepID=A0A848F9L0_9BURK|nr:YcfL family protein [Azohydromonas caseinilytica]NML15023.1 YcfL family protein [Azohydromonas caseinilytica]
MIHALRAAGLCAALLLTAALPAVAQSDAQGMSPAILSKLATRGDLKSVRVAEIRMARRNDMLVVEADFQNPERRDRFVYYRFRWLDGGGMQVGDGEGWKQLSLLGQQLQPVKAVAPSPAAADFRIEFNVE